MTANAGVPSQPAGRSTDHPASVWNPLAGPPVDPDGHLSLRDVMTDGALPELCDELSLIAERPVWVRDRDGMAIVHAVTDTDDPIRWRVVPEEDAARRAFERLGWRYQPQQQTLAVSIRAGHANDQFDIGALVTPTGVGGAGEPLDPDHQRMRLGTLERLLELVASSIAEAVSAEFLLSQRVQELKALARLSSMLSQAGDTDELLAAALELAVRLLDADAGVIEAPRDDAGGFDVRTTLGFEAAPPFEGPEREAALAGQIVEQTSDPDTPAPASMASMLAAGLFFQDAPVGLLRLYNRTRRVRSRGQLGLLRSLADQVGAALGAARLRRLHERDERIARQVRLAAQVQRRMLPEHAPDAPGVELAARYSPSFELSGDFYDFLDLDDGRIGLAVADVVGKGVPAALLMSSVRAGLRAHAQDVGDTAEVLRRVNEALVRDTLDSEFATLWYGVLDPALRRLVYCSCGHEWPILVRVPPDQNAQEEHLIRLTAAGMALGIDPDQRYHPGVFQLAPNDVLVVFTDGVTDTTNFENERFGGRRLRSALLELYREDPAPSAQRVVDHLTWRLRRFAGVSKRADDVSIVAMRILPDAPASACDTACATPGADLGAGMF